MTTYVITALRMNVNSILLFKDLHLNMGSNLLQTKESYDYLRKYLCGMK